MEVGQVGWNAWRQDWQVVVLYGGRTGEGVIYNGGRTITIGCDCVWR